MSVSYFLNWMGPVSLEWYEERGLTHKVERVVESELIRDTLRNSPKLCYPNIEIGDTYEITEIHTHYSAGRIDIRGLDEEEFYNGWDEYSLGVMHGEDWNALSDWLDKQEDETVRSYNELICDFEREYGKLIRWAK